MNIPLWKTVLAWVAALGVSACSDTQQRANDIVNWYIWENTTTWDMAYREWTPVPNFDRACDTTQPIFDRTTWETLAIIDSNIGQLAENNWDEVVILCDESNSWTDNIPSELLWSIPMNWVYR